MQLQVNDSPKEPQEVWNSPGRETHRVDMEVFLHSGYSIIVREQPSTLGEGRLILKKNIPRTLFDQYRDAALKKVTPRQLDDESWYADIPGLPGVWANEVNPRDCLNVLEEVLTDWLLLKIQHGDRDIPIMDDIDLNVI